MCLRVQFIFWVLLTFLIDRIQIAAEEGMYPLSQIDSIDLQAKGLVMDPRNIFDEHQASLSDAIVNIGGCTGSFVSARGLILTNHHCAFRAVRETSSLENDYIRNGFLASNRAQEKEAKGYTVRITESFKDVSAEVLKDINRIEDLVERHQTIEKRKKEMVERVEAENPGQRAEVAEMFSGESYVLFIYTYIRDVRLVYVPPNSIGNFGGENDNWEWPRHNADFAFMRAYVGPDGSAAEFSEKNVPYQPRKYVQINPRGAEEGDFVFLLGYPAKTYRHKTSHFLSYEQDLRMPFVAEWNRWQIELMEELAKNNPQKALKFSARIKGLANTEKNYRGKLQGMSRLNLVKQKQDEEKKIQALLVQDQSFSKVMNEIALIYEERREHFYKEMLFNYLLRSVNMLYLANTLYEATNERMKDDLDRKSAYMDRNFEMTKQRALLTLNTYDEELDKLILKELLIKANQLTGEDRIQVLDELYKLKSPADTLEQIIDRAFEMTRISDPEFLSRAFEYSMADLKKQNEPMLEWISQWQPELQKLEEEKDKRDGALTKLSAEWTEIKKKVLKMEFIPDANGTFRLTYGYIEGYSPADAVCKKPLTSLSGVIEKTTGVSPYDTPLQIIDLFKQKEYGSFASSKLNDLPVAILYSTDTSGGNSGSPVLNARGELIGLNFDRTFEATINDFAWSSAYSRSIGVDIRYILWIIQKVAGANHILDEIGVAVR